MLYTLLFGLAMVGMTIVCWYKELTGGLNRAAAMFTIYGWKGWFKPLRLVLCMAPLILDICITGSAITFFRFGEGLNSGVMALAMSNVLSVFIISWGKVKKRQTRTAVRMKYIRRMLTESETEMSKEQIDGMCTKIEADLLVQEAADKRRGL